MITACRWKFPDNAYSIDSGQVELMEDAFKLVQHVIPL